MLPGGLRIQFFFGFFSQESLPPPPPPNSDWQSPKLASGFQIYVSSTIYQSSQCHTSSRHILRHLSNSVSKDHRTSIIPGSFPSNKDFAKIIIQSQSAKIQKWKQQQQTNSNHHLSQSGWPADAQMPKSAGRKQAIQAENNPYHYEMPERFLQHTKRSVHERLQIPSFSASPEATKAAGKLKVSESCINKEEERNNPLPLLSHHKRKRRPSLIQTIGAAEILNKKHPNCTSTMTEQEASTLHLNLEGLFLPANPMCKSAANLMVLWVQASTASSWLVLVLACLLPCKLGTKISCTKEWVDGLNDCRQMNKAKLRAKGHENSESLANFNFIKSEEPPSQLF
ncbi:AGC protein kinase [Puccinia sorghi]|uniref:AGC protein kinase n=1 Tax=Puccinia sorghi TaxID=27349 RepID=A0A0L6VHR9_9BASI|nr:AGC protein kinase [Puccinia sorghi]